MTDDPTGTGQPAEGQPSEIVERPVPPSNIKIKTGTELPGEKK